MAASTFGQLLLSEKPISAASSSHREWNAPDYHRLSAPQVSWGKKVLARLRLRGDEIVLDAGCGTGRLTGELLEAVPRGRAVGIDLSQNMLRSAREHLRSDSRVSLVAGDLLHLPFKCVFDGVVSTAALHWVLDHDRLFTNFHDVLRPRGWLEAQCGGGPNLMAFRLRVAALANTPRFAEFFAGFREPWFFQTTEGTAEVLHRAGFVDVETSIEAAPTHLESAQQYREFITTIILRQHLTLIPRQDLRAAFAENLVEQSAADDPPFLLDYWRLNLRGTAG
jgi:trans-aconitate 2-methyltransferase